MKEKFTRIQTSAAAGLEAVVGREIRVLGLDLSGRNGRVRFDGDVSTIIKPIPHARADRIKIVVGSFPAKTFGRALQGKFLPGLGELPLGA